MKTLYYNYKFGKYFKVFFLQNSSYLILKKKSRFFFLKIPYIYFFKIKKNLLSFFFYNYFCYMSFFKHILQMNSKLTSFYYLRLKLKGLGYRIIHLSKSLVKMFFNRSNFFYVHIPPTILFKYKIRRLFFLSTKISDLKILMINLLLLKKYIVYRFSGLFYPRQIMLLKPGKNKYR